MDVPELMQKKPQHTEDPDKAPETWSSKNYGGRKGESGGIIAILEMLAEDVEKEIRESHADNADAKEKFDKQNNALQDSLDALEDNKANAERQLSDLDEKMRSYDKHRSNRLADAKAEMYSQQAIGVDCQWVKTHFEKRREKRKTEMQGLEDARGFLAGVAAGRDPLPPV